MKKKVLVAVCALIAIVFSAFAVGKPYLKERSELNDELFQIIESEDITNKKIYKNEFIDEIESIKNNYTFRSNSQIKELIGELNTKINSNKFLIDKRVQKGDKEIQAEIDNYLVNYKDYGVGKIFIYTDYNYGDELVKDDDYVNCSVYAYGLSDETIIDKDSKIKIRGNSTAYANKKPYNIKFSDKVDLYGFGEAKKWSFLAEAFEPTMLRNYLFLNFAREMGLEYTSNCDYVELWLDGKYNGTYLLTESVETGKNRVNIDPDNGDFLIEYESSRVEEDVTYIVTDHGWRFAMSDPEEPDEDTLQYLTDTINNLDSIVCSNNYENITEILDIDSFAKLYVLNEFAKTADFGFSSVNFYYKDGKFFAGPAWDFDQSSGNRSTIDTNYYVTVNVDGTTSVNSYENIYGHYNKIYDKLLCYPEFEKVAIECFTKYSNYMIDMYIDNGIIDTLLDKYGALIKQNYEPIEKNGAGWVCEYRVTDIIDYDDNVTYLKNWLQKRYEYLRKEWIK